MLLVAMRLLSIKDLKDLSVFWGGDTIDMQVLTDLKRFFHVNDRGGQAPALRAREGFSSPCAVRDQAIPNYSHYSHWGTRAIAGDRPPRYELILLILKIVIILLLILLIVIIL